MFHPSVTFQFQALFHHRGQDIVACGISLVFKISENSPAQGLVFVGWDQSVDGSLRDLLQSFARGLARGQGRHAASSKRFSVEGTLPLNHDRQPRLPPLVSRTRET